MKNPKMASIAIRYFFKNRFHHSCRYFSQSSASLSRSIILGIESSCDDTACAIVDSNRQILGESVYSQHDEVLRFGGILPLVAQHFHEQNIDAVVKNALKNAAMNVGDVDAIAVTTRPGLVLSLNVGLNYARELSKQYKKSFISIHHMEAHALVARLVYPQDLSFPYLTFLISGGHCLLAIVYSVRKFILLGKSIDTAPGEAFDKLARRLKTCNVTEFRNLSGGAAVEVAASRGNPFAITFKEPLLHQLNCNFSFAGLKSNMLQCIADQEQKYDIAGDEVLPNLPDVCASFQFIIAQHLCRRLQRAMEYIDRNKMLPENDCKLVVSGGVACNSYLLRAFRFVCQEMGYSLFVPPPKYCTDNGVMIAWNGVEKYREKIDVLSPNQVDEIRVEHIHPLGEDATAEVSRAAVKCTWIKLKNLLHPEADDEIQKSSVETNE